LLAKGNANKDIADRLELSLYTAETHCWAIHGKVSVHSFTELVLSGFRHGFLT